MDKPEKKPRRCSACGAAGHMRSSCPAHLAKLRDCVRRGVHLDGSPTSAHYIEYYEREIARMEAAGVGTAGRGGGELAELYSALEEIEQLRAAREERRAAMGLRAPARA